MPTATATVLADWTVRLSTDSPGVDGTWRRASFSGADVVISSRRTYLDLAPPLNTELVYVWTDQFGSVEVSVTVEAARPVLSSVLGGGGRAVTVVDQAPLRFEGRSRTHDVLYRADPVVAVQPARFASGTLVLWAANRAERVALLALLGSGEPLILRAVCPDAVDDMTLQPLSWEDPLVGDSDKRGARYLRIDYQAVSGVPTDYPEPPVWSWEDLEAEHATWADVEAAYATWDACEQGPTP